MDESLQELLAVFQVMLAVQATGLLLRIPSSLLGDLAMVGVIAVVFYISFQLQRRDRASPAPPSAAPGDLACDTCAICLDQTVAVLPCGHRFHTACAARWLQLKPSCPLCRTTV